MKLKLLLKHLKEDEPFEKVISFVSLIEFQKGGLLDAHIFVFLDQEAKFSTQEPINIGKVISAEIPSDTLPHLRELVLKHVIHYPCTENPTARCLREGRYSKRFPKPSRSDTAPNEDDNYVSYRRSPEEGGENNFRTGKNKSVLAMKIVVDN